MNKKNLSKLGKLSIFDINFVKIICYARNIFFILLVAFLIKMFSKEFLVFEGFSSNEDRIKKLTDKWVDSIVSNNDGDEAYQLVCSDGKLIGTIDKIEKKGENIKNYFNYFAKLPNIKVKKKKYNISEFPSDKVYTNTAFITWEWDDLEEPLTTKIEFTFKDKCMYEIKVDNLPQ